jgi:transketolase
VFNAISFYINPVTDLYYGYGQTDWPTYPKIDWKDISGVPDAIENLNIDTQVPDIFKISTVTGGGKELKMGDYKGRFDINGRAMSLEAKGATLQ